jgi:hypothetical protein
MAVIDKAWYGYDLVCGYVRMIYSSLPPEGKAMLCCFPPSLYKRNTEGGVNVGQFVLIAQDG